MEEGGVLERWGMNGLSSDEKRTRGGGKGGYVEKVCKGRNESGFGECGYTREIREMREWGIEE